MKIDSSIAAIVTGGASGLGLIAGNAPLAVQHTLAAARESLGQADGAARSFAAAHMVQLRRTEEFKEGPRAFVEKRAPVWTGR